MSQTVIIGASRQGRIVLEIIRAQGHHDVVGFLDDDVSKHGILLDGVPVLGRSDWATTTTERVAAAVAIGSNDARTAIARKLRASRIELLNAVHPSAVVMTGVAMGTGNLVCAGAVIVTGARLYDDVVVNTGTTIDHDCMVGNGAYLAPGVRTAGCVSIGQKAFVGVGAILGPGISIGERSVIGAGSVVLSDVPSNVVAFGSPARVVRSIEGEPDWSRMLAGSKRAT